MASLPAQDRAKLVRILGMLGSSHAGERDAAGLAAHRLLQARGVTWQEVVEPAPAAPREVAVAPGREVFVADAAACLQHSGLYNEWEQVFLRSVTRWRRLSRKQAGVLGELVERLRASGQYPG